MYCLYGYTLQDVIILHSIVSVSLMFHVNVRSLRGMLNACGIEALELCASAHYE